MDIEFTAEELAQAKCAKRENSWELFFPEGDSITAKIGYAKAICSTCPVAVACFTQAMNAGADTPGIWGMTTQRERTIMRRDSKLVQVHLNTLKSQTDK